MPTPPYRMWDVVERASTGPFCEQKEFLQKIFVPKLKEVVRKYGIKYDPKFPIPNDDSLVDGVWEAAVELFRDVGIYNQDTHRRIIFSDKEIQEALSSTIGEYNVGIGKDSRILQHRGVEDRTLPFVIFSPDIIFDEEDFLMACIAYLKEPLLDGFCAPILEESMGMRIQSGTPVELAGSLEHAMSLREATRLVGRPGVFLVAVGTSQSAASQIAASDPEWGVRTTDSRLVGSITEFMTNNSMMNKAIHYQQYGCYAGNLTGALYGGYAGGAEGTAVLEAAYHLNGLMVHQSQYQMNFPYHLKYFSNTTRELLWVVSVYSQAVARHTKLVNVSNGFANAGPGTEMLFFEAAAHSVASTVSGANLWEVAPARNKNKNRATPLEARLAAEVGHAVARSGMTREEANRVVNELLLKYEDKIADAPLGKEFRECYDVRKATPTVDYVALYEDAKEEIAKIGIDFPY